MKIHRAKKTAATVGLVCAIVLTSFALGLAQDAAPRGLRYSFGLQTGVPDDASCLGGHALRFGLALKPGDSSISSAKLWPHAACPSSLRAVRNPLSIFWVTKPRKISLYLLDSVLLI